MELLKTGRKLPGASKSSAAEFAEQSALGQEFMDLYSETFKALANGPRDDRAEVDSKQE